jgi:hypothetical protein
MALIAALWWVIDRCRQAAFGLGYRPPQLPNSL